MKIVVAMVISNVDNVQGGEMLNVMDVKVMENCAVVGVMVREEMDSVFIVQARDIMIVTSGVFSVMVQEKMNALPVADEDIKTATTVMGQVN